MYMIGYSFIKLSDHSEVSWSPGLPIYVSYTYTDYYVQPPQETTGSVSLDRPGLIVPDSVYPQYMLVERWQLNEEVTPNYRWKQPEEYINVTWEDEVAYPPYGRIVCTKVEEPIPQIELDELLRIQGIETDPETLAIMNRLRTFTSAELDAYLEANISNVQEIKAVLKRVEKILAVVIKQMGL